MFDNLINRFARTILFCLLISTALLKLSYGYSRSFTVSPAVYYIVTGFELVLACATWSRYWRLVAVASIAISVAGLVLDWWTGESCGCLGARLDVQGPTHSLLSGVFIMLCLLALWSDPHMR